MKSVILGKQQVNGFFSVNDGDIYELRNGQDAIVKAGQGIYWSLRHIKDGKADYSLPAVKDWENIEGHSAMIHMINREWILAQEMIEEVQP
jgi:hypothetical protein